MKPEELEPLAPDIHALLRLEADRPEPDVSFQSTVWSGLAGKLPPPVGPAGTTGPSDASPNDAPTTSPPATPLGTPPVDVGTLAPAALSGAGSVGSALLRAVLTAPSVVPLFATASLGVAVGAAGYAALAKPEREIVYVERIVEAPPSDDARNANGGRTIEPPNATATEPPTEPTAEPIAPSAPSASPPSIAGTRPASRREAPAETTGAVATGSQPPPPTTAPTASGSAYDSELATDRALLDTARTAIARGDGDGALVALAKHEQRFPQSQFADEREVIAVQALVAAGRRDAAYERAKRFAAARPKSPLLPALESALGRPLGP
jgi:hypothetical protein